MMSENAEQSYADIKVASDYAPDQSLALAMILLGRFGDRGEAYRNAVRTTVEFVRRGERDNASAFAAAVRWMLSRSWHKD